MDFGYFTLSDNHYPHHLRSASDFVLEIRDQAMLADRLGFHSLWIGEHHFDRLGVNSRPDLLLASIIPESRRIRLAPAVTVLPLHHPLHVAETWATLDLLSGGRVDFAAGRDYDRQEYEPFGMSFMESQERFAEGIDVVLKACGRRPGCARQQIDARGRPFPRPKPDSEGDSGQVRFPPDAY
jgi:alkanesulfonate monooxygenase SsuD/methylene tetrahydromethanopterin reductase-like flavin-dependent oxidoreductase (luciferase family)